MNKEFLAKKKDIDELKNGKVDKEEGKGLSQNDFTNIHKEAVEAIPEELQQKADLFHTHSKSDINDLDSVLDEKLSVASRNYVPVKYVSDSMDFNTDFQLTSADPNKVIFTNTKSVFNSNSPVGVPMPYMLTVERLYINGASNYFRQTFTGLMNAGSESAYIVEYQRLYIYTANPFWTDWKECDAAPLWSDITDKPETFPPEAHRHGISDVDDLDSALSEKLSVASRNYVPIRSVTESANFNTDFQLTDDDPNKVIFINTRATGNTNIPTGIPMPYMLTVDRLYSNGNYYVLRQSFTGLSNYAAENARIIEYERLYVCVTTNPFWTEWKKCDTAVLDTKFDTAGSGLTADGTTIKHTDIYSGTGFGNYHQQKYITWGDTISVPWGGVNSSGHLTTSGTVDVVLPEPLWGDITDKPGTFPPSDHSHSIGDINNLDSTLNGKLSVSSRNYVPVKYVSDSMDFNTDFQLTSADPNKVIFTNTKSVLNSHDPTGIPMPYMLTVERLYVNGASNYFRQTFTGLMNAGSESAYIVEYQRLYIYTASPFWTDWKAIDSGEDDHKVIQEYVGGADYEYPILCSTDTEHTQSATTDKVLKLLGMTINPKTGTITAPKFKGILEGRASSADSVEWGNVSDKPESYPPETHSHNYAASTYAGGAALSANKLNTDAGSATVPVYFSGGVPAECTYELNKTVPADAVFTDGCIDQRNSSGNFSLPLLLGFNNDTDVNGFAWKNSKFKANPSTGELFASTFNGQIAWGNVTGKPSVFPPESHSHAWSSITGKPETFPPETHSHNYAASSTPGGAATRAVSDSKGVNIAGQFEDVRNDIALNRTALGTQCKNLLKLTLTTKTVSGITFTVNDDYSITLNGTAKKTIWLKVGYTMGRDFRKEKLIFTGNPSGTGSGNGLEAWYMNSTTGNKYVSIANGNILTESEYDSSGVIAYQFHIDKGRTYNNVTYYPMLRYATITDDTYEPYQPSLQEQINQLSDTSNSGKLLYSMSEVVSSPLTVNITGLFTAYTVVVCNVVTSDGRHSLTLPLQYIKSLGTSAYYEAEGRLFYYVDDNSIQISTGMGQSNPTINAVKIISLF